MRCCSQGVDGGCVAACLTGPACAAAVHGSAQWWAGCLCSEHLSCHGPYRSPSTEPMLKIKKHADVPRAAVQMLPGSMQE